MLWLGLGLCAWAIWRLEPQFRALGQHATVERFGFAAAVLATVWWLAVASWRQMVLAFTGVRLPWPNAIRQLGLLLVGKYVPGSVFGFLARHYDLPASIPRSRVLAAGLYEQLVGLAMPIAAGAICGLAAYTRQPWWLVALPGLPWVVAAGLEVTVKAMRVLPSARLRGMGEALGSSLTRSPFQLLLGCTLALLATLGWLLLVFAMARVLLGASGYAALGVAGAFGLAVAVGMLVVIAPGGVGAREGAFVALAAHWLTPAQGLLLAAAMRLASVALDLGAGLAGAVVVYWADRPGQQSKGMQ